MKKIRESNFELLRCVLMFMVVLLHYNNTAMGKAFLYVVPNTWNYYLVYFMESLAIIGTNGFILLTGYFSWKKKETSLRKPLGLLIYVVAYNILFYFIKICFLKMPFSLKEFAFCLIPRNWYIVLYVVLILLSPYINTVIREMNKKSCLLLLTIMMCVFSIWPTILDILWAKLGIDISGVHTISIVGSASGYSIVNFVLLYVIGAAIAKFKWLRYPMWIDIVGYLLCSIIICIQQITIGGDGWSYANPFVITSCVFFFNIFRKLRLRSKWINKMAKASLGVFLIHTQYFVCIYAWEKSEIASACKGNTIGLLLHMVAVCMITYLLCSLLDMICRWAVRPISKKLNEVSVLKVPIAFVDEP